MGRVAGDHRGVGLMHHDDDEDDAGLEGEPNGFWTVVALLLVLGLIVWAMKGG